jgi:Flp pilus assembly pilin Flp
MRSPAAITFKVMQTFCIFVSVYGAMLCVSATDFICMKRVQPKNFLRLQAGGVSVEYLLVTAIVGLVLFYNFDGNGSAVELFFNAIKTLYRKFTFSLSQPT